MSTKAERLVTLTIALLETHKPLSFEEVNNVTKGRFYGQSDFRAARRMFERDKDELRRHGIPIQTQRIPFEAGEGYIISRKEYEFPGIDLNAQEVAALALAVRLTGTEGTPLAFAKLAAAAPDPTELPAPTTEVRVTDTMQDSVAEALTSRTPITFPYRTGSGQSATRVVDPYGIVQGNSGAYVVGFDHDRQGLRAFRFDRMRETPVLTGEPGAYEVPKDVDLGATIQTPGTDIEVELAASEAAAWSVQLRGGVRIREADDGREVYLLKDFHPTRDQAWLMGLDGVTVLAPSELADRVAHALARVKELHQ